MLMWKLIDSTNVNLESCEVSIVTNSEPPDLNDRIPTDIDNVPVPMDVGIGESSNLEPTIDITGQVDDNTIHNYAPQNSSTISSRISSLPT